MSGIKISIDENFINNFITKIIKDSDTKKVKDLHLSIENDIITLNGCFIIFGKEKNISSSLELVYFNKNFYVNPVKLKINTYPGVSKIIDGISDILKEITEGISFEANIITLEFSKMNFDAQIKNILNSFTIDNLVMNENKFFLTLGIKSEGEINV
ncbi:MAG: hypothetical protein H7A31_04635 [Thermotogae bacterium]|nr:hypothetical protein [Thermotogota bacterium]MCP5465964.1 hypothetical protein [Thermotogota bacterium]HOO74620.1 hypothetical protein [Tepiditoga sp.]